LANVCSKDEAATEERSAREELEGGKEGIKEKGTNPQDDLEQQVPDLWMRETSLKSEDGVAIVGDETRQDGGRQ